LRRIVNAVSSCSSKVYPASPVGFFEGIRRIVLVAQNAFSAFRTIHHMASGERGVQGIGFGKRLRIEFRSAEPALYEQFLDSWHLQPSLVARAVQSVLIFKWQITLPRADNSQEQNGFGAGSSRARPYRFESEMRARLSLSKGCERIVRGADSACDLYVHDGNTLR
jgi:hypothetical protein